MTIENFIKEFKHKGIKNTNVNPNMVSDYIKKVLEVKETLPFREKRQLAETVVNINTVEVDGVWKHDSINAYVAFVVGAISTHTNLEFGDDPVEDYDLLVNAGLLVPIIDTFQADYTECEVLLKMALTDKMSDNDVNIFIGKFLNGILSKLDGVGEILKDKLEDIDIQDVLGGKFNPEDLDKLTSFLNKYNN